jgi:hypothetical protein
MNRPIVKFLFLFVIICSNSHAQPWRSLSRQQKDSVIYDHFNQGNMYIGIGLGGTLLSGGWHGFSYKIEPTFGYYIFNRQMVSASLIIEQAETSYNGEYMKSHQIRGGTYYRYYLPERKVLHLFFVQVGFLGGKFYGGGNPDGIIQNTELLQLTLSVGGGISFSINKFNLEIGISQDYELINQVLIKDFIAGGTLGFIKLSYSF